VAIGHHHYLDYPSMMCVLRKGNGVQLQGLRFKRHLCIRKEFSAARTELLLRYSDDWSNIVIWGCSDEAFQIIKNIPDKILAKIELLDSSPSKIGKSILGLKIKSPSLLNSIDNVLVVVAPTTPKIVQNIREEVHMSMKSKKYAIFTKDIES
jgi:hypothetical protein